MTKTSYLFDIEHASTAGELRELRQLAATDPELNAKARQHVCQAIALAFNRRPRRSAGAVQKRGAK
jgi:hypothetical protein